ncbi:hypothetical protein HYZ97_03170, partial [Candidatus Pacearchaeota archaeon]|nr:hypothetical protein [Candidatus Pacearchaeota archaeon]
MIKRIFVLDNKTIAEEVIVPTIQSIEVKPNLEVTYCYDRKKFNFPPNYDAYLIHVSHTSPQALEDLKKAQPWSIVIGRTTMPNEHLNWDI